MKNELTFLEHEETRTLDRLKVLRSLIKQFKQSSNGIQKETKQSEKPTQTRVPKGF